MPLFYRTKSVLCGFWVFLLVVGVVAVLSVGPALANWPDYDDRTFTGSGGCKNCHGEFRSNNDYVSMVDGQNWTANLMDGHGAAFGIGCDACHTGNRNDAVYLASSDGEGSLPPLGCLGCHGRDEGSGVTGAGLRQHHWNAGITSCIGCHGDSDPGSFTTVSEDVMPPYYGNPDFPDIPDHPCNLEGYNYSEDVLGAAGTGGTDNDGDHDYDTADPDCAGVVSAEPTTWGRIKALYQ